MTERERAVTRHALMDYRDKLTRSAQHHDPHRQTEADIAVCDRLINALAAPEESGAAPADRLAREKWTMLGDLAERWDRAVAAARRAVAEP